MFRLSHPTRVLALGLAVAALFTASAVASDQASALNTKSCAQQIIDDWFGNGRVDKIYPLPCYPAAIKALPPDLAIYGNAEEEIRRAWAFAKVGKPDPGNTQTTPTTPTDPSGTDTTQTTKTTKTTKTDTTPTTRTDTVPTTATTEADTSGPSSVPVPLLVLGGLAVLLLAAGSAGYIRRRRDAGGDDGPGSDGPGDDPNVPPTSA